ncbi:MAG TPA: acyl carrier protein, partial [Sulfuricaulis sp.]|nr:acyl carrier protein [Sulfuricaulis sp.]
MAGGQQEQDAQQTAEVILQLVQRLGAELHPTRTAAKATLDSLLDRELGFDSLGRVELLARIERALNISLPEQVLVTAETPRDLLRAAQQAVAPAGPGTPSPAVKPAPREETAETPEAAATLIEMLDWHV